MKISGLRFKLTALCLCAVMFACVAAQPMYAAANEALANLQSQQQNLNNRLDQLAQEQKQIQANINNARAGIEREREIKANIDRQIAITIEEIEILEEKIENLRQEIEIKEGEIEVKEGEIDAKQAEHDASYELFRQRLRAMYMFGDASVIGLVFGAESFVDFLSRTDTITRVAEHDRHLMHRLTNERIELEAERAALDRQREDLEDRRREEENLRDETEEKRATLAVQSQQAAIRIQDMADLERQFQADLSRAQAMQRQMENELQEVLRQIEWSTNPYIGGELVWPVPGFTTISSHFGPRFNGRDNHTGMDITGNGIHGKPVVAANSGTVVIANTSFTPGRGYGIYVMLDHGGRVATLYGHLSSISVKVGDVVRRGQEIGKVGSTGWSTGPHLHFEYRENDRPINPLPKLQGR
ncbi:MAG: peptidoglycan DD-metalloendopeptidase family protein [Oscillospiraceae bacterium]|nr:peptidoglycan DD-metalloendopeptidase family protein [Oscillospiraceae bacterium]